MREDIPHPDKRKSWRVVLHIPEDSPETWKGIRFALPLHSQALRGMVWDWRSFHSLVPKVASFGVSHKEEREHKLFTRRRELTTDYVVFGGRLRRGCFAPLQPHSWCPHTRREIGEKKSAANVTEGWHIYLPVIYCICWRATRFFDWPSRTTYHFSRLRGLRVLYFPYLRVLWIFPPMCSPIIIFLCGPSAPFVKKTTSQKVDIRRLRWYNKITKSTRGFAPERKVGMSCKCCGCACHEHTTDTDAYKFSDEYAQKMAEISADTEATPISLHGHIVCEVHPDEDIKVLAAELSSLID